MKKCTVPFNQLYIHSSGEVYPCCYLQNDPDYSLGNIKGQRIQEIWRSEKLLDFRKMHELKDESGRCKKEQGKNFCNHLCHHDIFNDDLSLKRIDIMLDSKCNLKCIMCTNIFDERGGLDSDFFWTENIDTLKELKEIEVIGGEPVISPYFYKLVDLMLKINPTCRWKITTNLNYQFNSRLSDVFETLNINRVIISIDSLNKEIFSKIRINSDYDLIIKNIFILKKFNFPITLNMVVQHYNAHELFSAYEFSKENNFHFYPILLTDPSTYSILNYQSDMINSLLNGYLLKNLEVKSLKIFMFIKTIYQQLSSEIITPENKMLYFENVNIFQS